MPKKNICDSCDKIRQCLDAGVLKKGERRIACSKHIEKKELALFSLPRMRERKEERGKTADAFEKELSDDERDKDISSSNTYGDFLAEIYFEAEADLSIVLDRLEKLETIFDLLRSIGAAYGYKGLKIGDTFLDKYGDSVEVVGFILGRVIVKRPGAMPFIEAAYNCRQAIDNPQTYQTADRQFVVDEIESVTKLQRRREEEREEIPDSSPVTIESKSAGAWQESDSQDGLSFPECEKCECSDCSASVIQCGHCESCSTKEPAPGDEKNYITHCIDKSDFQ